MATRKKTPDAPTLWVEAAPSKPTYRQTDEQIERDIEAGPKLSLVPPLQKAPDSEVIVESLADGRFVVSLCRHQGTAVAAVTYTRPQLMQFIARAHAALEVR